MKAINVTELKAHLSKYLRQASRGARIAVKDRDEAIAEIGPPSAGLSSWRERLVQSGRLRAGTQRWSDLRISASDGPVDIQASLQAVREDPSEVRRR
jgi:antitoxin (DNA-binding transcriptional repressor) of toxin-antitoxin stability system